MKHLTFSVLFISVLATTWTLVPTYNNRNIEPHGHDVVMSKQIGAFNAFTTTQAESFSYANDVEIESCTDTLGAQQVDFIEAGDVIAYYDMDFQNGAYRVDIRVATRDDFATIGYINLHLGNATTLPFASILTRNTPDYTWVTLSQYIEDVPTGIQDLYFTFTSDDAFSHITDFNWFQFNKD